MPEDPFEESLRYAFEPVLLKLYAVSIVGWFLMEFSEDGFLIVPPEVRPLITIPVSLCGLALFVGGVVGVLHRTLADATETAS